ncbi:MAG TPA: pitrilysin family protein, partial [Clostridiales bacterium]|nr:pitrilysin family protein [Clostridiales bacterium]
RKRSSLDIANETDLIGAQLNAYTSKEYTCFYIRTLPEFGARGIEILGDIVTDPVFAASDVDTERGVILEEINMYNDDPEDLAADGIFQAAWTPHPLGRNIVGTSASVGGVNSGNLRAFYEQFYRPENIVVAVSGNFDENRVAEALEKAFSSLKKTGFEKMQLTAPIFNFGNTVSFSRKTEQLQLCLAYPGVQIGSKQAAAMSLFNSAAGGAASSRLFRRVREDLGLAYSIYSYFTAHLGGGVFTVSAGISPAAKKQALSEIDGVLKGLLDGITSEELERAKNQASAGLAMGYENSYNLAMDMGRREILGLPQRTERQSRALIASVTLDAVRDLAQQTLKNKPASCFAGKLK